MSHMSQRPQTRKKFQANQYILFYKFIKYYNISIIFYFGANYNYQSVNQELFGTQLKIRLFDLMKAFRLFTEATH